MSMLVAWLLRVIFRRVNEWGTFEYVRPEDR